MSVITLTTDFGTKDHFVGAVKGAIFTELPDVHIVDISHRISPFNITETAYVLKNSYKSFPKGSVHIIGVDSELNDENKHLAIKLDDHYFICADNGIISLITSEIRPEKIVEINIHDRVETSFPVLDVFVKVACHIARGGQLEIIGKIVDKCKKLVELQPTISNDNNSIFGDVIYIDNYGNVVSNISKKTFIEVGQGRDFEVIANKYTFKTINKKYSDIVNFDMPIDNRKIDGKKLAIFNSAGFLEIAIYRSNLLTVGGASSLLGMKYRDVITVRFLNND